MSIGEKIGVFLKKVKPVARFIVEVSKPIIKEAIEGAGKAYLEKELNEALNK